MPDTETQTQAPEPGTETVAGAPLQTQAPPLVEALLATAEPVPAVKPETRPEQAPAAVVDPRIAEMQRELERQSAAMEQARADARDALAERLGVLPGYRAMMPKADPFTPEGKAAMQKWAQEHPEVVRRADPRAQSDLPDVANDLAKRPGAFLVDVNEWRRNRQIARGER